jgi:hypothetical protein
VSPELPTPADGGFKHRAMQLAVLLNRLSTRNDSATVSTYRHLTVPVLEILFNSFKYWLQVLSIAVNVLTKSTVLLFVQTA